MQELTTTATLVDYEALDTGSPITTVLARSELEAALHADESAQLWFELGLDEGEQTRRLTIDLDTAALEQMLRLGGGDDILVAFDGDAVAGLFAEPEVEAHGLRGALAATVAIAAIAAPTSLAAVPQSAETASTAQRASLAATAQTADLAATRQVSSLVANPQVSKLAAKQQINKQLVLKAGGLKLLRGGLGR